MVATPIGSALMRELKRLGWSNALVERTRGASIPPHLLARVIEVYFERFADADRPIRATFRDRLCDRLCPPSPPTGGHCGTELAKVRLADALGRDPQGRDRQE